MKLASIATAISGLLGSIVTALDAVPEWVVIVIVGMVMGPVWINALTGQYEARTKRINGRARQDQKSVDNPPSADKKPELEGEKSDDG